MTTLEIKTKKDLTFNPERTYTVTEITTYTVMEKETYFSEQAALKAIGIVGAGCIVQSEYLDSHNHVRRYKK
jgi:hypothetical protein